MKAAERFTAWLRSGVEFKDHLQFLYLHAEGNVLELGVREGIATSALLYGVEQNGGKVWSVDLNDRCSEVFRSHPNWKFIHGNSLDVARLKSEGVPSELDLLFCDTIHTYEQVNLELKTWGPSVKPTGLIMVHDVNKYPQTLDACEGYAKANGMLIRVRPGNGGLAVIASPERKGDLK